MIAISRAVPKRWKIGHRRRAGCGTAFRPRSNQQIIELALDQSELSPRELAVRFTDEKRYFVSEATADAYFGRAPAIIKQRERIKRQTIEHLRLRRRRLAA